MGPPAQQEHDSKNHVLISNDLWRNLARQDRQAPWLLTHNRIYSRSEALSIAKSLGDKLIYKQREHVSLCLQDPTHFILLLFALWLRGVVPVPINPAFPAQQRKILLEQTACQNYLDDTFFAASEIKAILEKVCEPPSYYPDFIEDTWAIIIFTSGSSGTPKAVILSLGNLFHNAAGANNILSLDTQDKWLLSLPLFHVGGLGIVLRTLLAGASIVVPHPNKPLSTALQTHNITHLSLVPTQLYRLMNDQHSRDNLRQLKLILVGGAGISPQLLQKVKEDNLPVYASYGCTEMASQVVSFPIGHSAFPHNTAPSPTGEWRLNQTQEIEVRGRTRFVGYWTDQGLKCPFDTEGWFATGDLGRWQEGRLEVYGRKDAMFISGGENIHPETIERSILNDSEIQRVIVVPVQDTEFGTRPVAFVDSAWYQPTIWDTRLRKQLTGFQVPDLFLPWPEEHNDNLKPNRKTLSIAAQPLFDEWARWRFLRNWLKHRPPGWKHPLAFDGRHVFQVIDHKNHAQPRQIFALAESREQVMSWLLNGAGRVLLTPKSITQAWHVITQPLHRDIHERIEVIRLLTEDLYPETLTAFDATVSNDLKQYALSFSPAFPQAQRHLVIVENKAHLHYAICLGTDSTVPINENAAPILQVGIYLPDTQRSYLLRFFYKKGNYPKDFIGWKVQSLREPDGLERDQPFWNVTVSEERLLETLMLRQGLLPKNLPPRANTPSRERHRRAEWEASVARI